jgi:hypothetical protein
MNSSEIDPLVKEAGHGQSNDEDLLKDDQKVDTESDPRGYTVLVQKKHKDG